MHKKLVDKCATGSEGTLTVQFLKTNKVTAFLERSGEAEVVWAAGGKKDKSKNIKFLKILMYYSQGFTYFINACSKCMADSAAETDTVVQMFKILNQVTKEILDFKFSKSKDSATDDERRENEGGKRQALKAVEIKPDQETIDRRNEREAKELLTKEKTKKQNDARNYQKTMGNSEVIIFDNEQDDEAGYQMKRSTGKRFDQKTQEYLDKIKGLQYNDEYDDTLEFDDNQKKKREVQSGKNHKVMKMKIEDKDLDYEDNDDDEEGREEDDQDYEQGNGYSQKSSGPQNQAQSGRGRGNGRGAGRGAGRGQNTRGMEQNAPRERVAEPEYSEEENTPSRGGNRGRGFNRRGRGGSDNFNDKQKNKREYEQKNR